MIKIFLLIPFGFLWIQLILWIITPGELFGFVTSFSDWLEERWAGFHGWISKPLWGCWVCMSSVHGALIFSLAKWLFPEAGYRWVELPVFCVMLGGFIITYSEILNNGE